MTFTSNHSDLKQINRLAVLNLVKKQPCVSRADIAKHTGLNKSTIGKIVQELLDEDWLKEEAAPTLLEGAGRRPTGLTINGDVLTVLGAEFGVDYIAVVACSIAGEVRFQSVLPYVHSDLGESVVQLATILCRTWELMLSLNHRVLGLGVSVPGLVRVGDELVLDLPNLGWRDFDLIALLQAQFAIHQMPDLPISIINDANAGALSEFVFGESQFERNSLVHLTLSVGVGAGIVHANGLLKGYDGWAGEIGHSILQPLDGHVCACGQRGCVETLVSQRALSREVVGAGPMLSIDEMLRLLAQDDVRMTRALEKVGYYLGIVLHNVANIVNPKSIVLGGALARLGDNLLNPALRSFEQFTRHSLIKPNVRLCSFGQNAASLGAAAFALSKYLEPEDVPLYVRERGLLRKV